MIVDYLFFYSDLYSFELICILYFWKNFNILQKTLN